MISGLDRFNNGDERRNASRFIKDGGSDFAVLYLAADEPHLVEVHDESLGGLCLCIEPHLTLTLNQEVDIIYASSIFRGIVRNIRDTSSPRQLVGFHCEPIIALRRAALESPTHANCSEPV